MNIKKFARAAFCRPSAAAIAGVLLSLGTASANAELVEARIPVRINVAAAVSIEPPDGAAGTGATKTVAAGEWDTLTVMFDATSSISYRPQGRASASPVIRYNNGTVSIQLHPRQYGKTSLALYSVSGKRVLSGKASATSGALNISRPGVAPGVYLLSVRGDGGNTHSTKLTHSGGRLNINAAFVGNVRSLGKEAYAQSSAGSWMLTASASAAGYVAKRMPVALVAGLNSAWDITLEQDFCHGFTDGTTRMHHEKEKPQFCDRRDGKRYVYVEIGTQTWMAENLNFTMPTIGGDSAMGVCYDFDESNCVTYGRFYRWSEAMNIPRMHDTTLWGGSDVKHRGICPVGWHVPSYAEWTTLDHFVNTNPSSATFRNSAVHLKSQTGWEHCAPTGPDNYNNSCDDTHGFSALPAGGVWSYDASGEAGHVAAWWSATEGGYPSAPARQAFDFRMQFNFDRVLVGGGRKAGWNQLRCVKD